MGNTLAREWLEDVDLDCPLRGVGSNHHGFAEKHIVGACNNLGGNSYWRVVHAYYVYCGLKDGSSLGGDGEIPAAVAANLHRSWCDRRSSHDLSCELVCAGMNEEQALVQPNPNLNSFPLKRLAVALQMTVI